MSTRRWWASLGHLLASEFFFDDWTALHSAAACNALEVASLLLTHGADVNAKDGIDRTALHWAAMKGHTEMADLLRRHGGKE